MIVIGKELKIYLGGKMNGLTYKQMNQWRVEATKKLKTSANCTGYKVNVINPVYYFNFEERKQQTELEVMNYDLKHVETSDILIINLSGLTTSIGTSIEIYRAYQLGIPILCFGYPVEYDKLHPWIKCCITRYEEKVNDVIDYIRNFYFI